MQHALNFYVDFTRYLWSSYTLPWKGKIHVSNDKIVPVLTIARSDDLCKTVMFIVFLLSLKNTLSIRESQLKATFNIFTVFIVVYMPWQKSSLENIQMLLAFTEVLI